MASISFKGQVCIDPTAGDHTTGFGRWKVNETGIKATAASKRTETESALTISSEEELKSTFVSQLVAKQLTVRQVFRPAHSLSARDALC
jgi:hypothetical protein